MNWPCTACGAKGYHTAGQCSQARPRCHACRENPTCIQAIANGCRPTCLDCYFERRIINRVVDRKAMDDVRLLKHNAYHCRPRVLRPDGVWLDPPEDVRAAGTVIGCDFRLAEMAEDCRRAA